MRDMPRSAQVYLCAVVAGAVVLCVLSLLTLALGAFVATAVLVVLHIGSAKVSEFKAAGDSNLSPGGVLILVALFVAGPACAVLVAAVDFVAEDRSRPLHKRAFNAAEAVVSTAAAGAAMVATGGSTSGLDEVRAAALVPASCASLAMFLATGGLVACIIAMNARTSVVAVMRGLFGPASLVVLGNQLIGIGIAAAWLAGGGPMAGVIGIIPVLGARHVYAVAASQRRAYDATVSTLIKAVETKDRYTRGHSERVAEGSVLIGRQLRMSEARVDTLRYAGMLHDSGKVGVPTRILQSTGKLTAVEFDRIKEHPTLGHRLLEDITFLDEARAGILHHHERLDGTGYPAGLKGNTIPEFGRVIAVADAFDSMTSTRSFRGARSVEHTITELQRCAGTQFDPRMVDALVRALDQQPWAHSCTEEQPAPLVPGIPQQRGSYDDTLRSDVTASS